VRWVDNKNSLSGREQTRELLLALEKALKEAAERKPIRTDDVRALSNAISAILPLATITW